MAVLGFVVVDLVWPEIVVLPVSISRIMSERPLFGTKGNLYEVRGQTKIGFLSSIHNML